jgi:hypothetical protein
VAVELDDRVMRPPPLRPACAIIVRYHIEMARAARSAVVAAAFGLAVLATLPLSADARGGHELGLRFLGHGMHGTKFAGGRRHGNDTSIKAASDEREKLLNTQLQSICRGC